ncbi:peptidyl-prolyl cis-trans isomerase [Sphingomonas sp. NFR15]|uniref:peptidyl-prolyl cis-trans isomerase n=1 Tax=Sphingomonas sp. NFR15 TaxID=1566282 RepID=UPI00088063BC|nr:peptidyl-prolyl cis-trans isomerase [Sphingomonas sp. NFR15]SDA22768.1 peptidyl-prolyl cis-trans isomerase, EpsD family [Sphingomonas sp. NFR15]
MFEDGIVCRIARRFHVIKVATVLGTAAGLAGCGTPKTPDQLIAKGDKFEVTLGEYDQFLRQMPPVTKEAVAPMRRMLLQQLVNEKLLAEAAISAKMEDDPANSQAIAAAKRAILAQAYIRNLTGKLPKAEPREIEAYYNAHPALFSNRRRFIVEEYVLKSDMPDIRSYVDALTNGDFNTLAAVVSNKIPFLQPTTVARFTDELPDNRDMLDTLTVGSSIVYQSPGQLHLGRIQSVTLEPVPLEAATGKIERSLADDRVEQIAQAAVKTLRKSRNVEILNANLKQAVAEIPPKGPRS